MSETKEDSNKDPLSNAGDSWDGLTQEQKSALQSAVFQRLIGHLQNRTDVQNIDLMNHAGFCRNCLSRWLAEEASERGLALDKDSSRHHVYGMDASEWKKKYQKGDTKKID